MKTITDTRKALWLNETLKLLVKLQGKFDIYHS